MAAHEKLTTVLSTKGQVILPKAVRLHQQWEAGTRLVVEETSEGVLLRAAPCFPVTEPEDVFGMLPFSGPAKSIEDMDAAIAVEARRQNAGD